MKKTSVTHSAFGTLTLVGTPIGNLADMPPRAIAALQAASIIAAEDTRHTKDLLQKLGIKLHPAQKVLAYHDHNEASSSKGLLSALQTGQNVALVSDAGMPLVADPGYKIVQLAAAAGISITSIPGPNAALLALQLSALPSDMFYFAGFLPAKDNARHAALAALLPISATLIFYEAPQRLVATLTAMHSVFGARPAAVARELTKMFEEVQRGTLADLAAHYTTTQARGECVIVVHGNMAAPSASSADLTRMLRPLLAVLKAKEAAKILAAQTGCRVTDAYDLALQLKDETR